MYARGTIRHVLKIRFNESVLKVQETVAVLTLPFLVLTVGQNANEITVEHGWGATRSANKRYTSTYFTHQQMHYLLNLEKFKIYFKIHTNIAPTCFGLRTSSGSLY